MGLGEIGPNSYRVLLLEEFSDRKRRNPSYSLSAFSRTIGVSPPSLSQIISGKRPLSRKTAKRILEKCLFSPEKRHAFLHSAFGKIGDPYLDQRKDGDEYQELEIDVFKMIGDWYHYAILSLGDIRPNKADPRWISSRLGISVTEAQDAFDRLVRLGLIKRNGQGFSQSSKPLCVRTETSKSALRKHHHQNLRKAEETLDSDTVALELFSSMTMAVNEDKLPRAREIIKDFRRKLCRVLEDGNRHRVYTLAIQLFPVSKKENEI